MLRWLLAGGLVLGVPSASLAAVDVGPSSLIAFAPRPTSPARMDAPVQAAPSTAQPPAEPPTAPEKTEEDTVEPPAGPRFHVTGTADFYWENNFNNPFNGKNQFRAFDYKDDQGPHLSYAEIAFQLDRKPFGFRLDFDFGPAAAIVNALEPSSQQWLQYIQQAYVSANLTRDGKNFVDFGKWVTPHGAEVIEARDNWNYSRSLLFTWAIPFYHVGLRGYHYFNDTEFIQANVTRGWNDVTDNNHSATFGLSGLKQFGPSFTVVGSWMGGDEPLFTRSDGFRNIFDVTATYTPLKKGGTYDWLFALNGDFIYQQDVTFPSGKVGSASWKGLAGYVRYIVDPKQALTARGEVFSDPNGAATGVRQTINEFTLTYEYRLNKYVITKAEYRHDFSNQAVFFTNTRGANVAKQDTLGVAAIFAY